VLHCVAGATSPGLRHDDMLCCPQVSTAARAEVITFYQELLNKGVTPVCAVDEDASSNVLQAIAAAANGVGSAVVEVRSVHAWPYAGAGLRHPSLIRVACLPTVPAAALQAEVVPVRIACANAGIALLNPRLSDAEFALIAEPAIYLRAAACIGALGASRLVRASTVTAAITMERMEVPSQHFGRDVGETRPHRGLAEAAMLLGNLLQSSSKPKPPKGKMPALVPCVAETPEVHGLASDTVATVGKAARIEFSADAAGCSSSAVSLKRYLEQIEVCKLSPGGGGVAFVVACAFCALLAVAMLWQAHGVCVIMLCALCCVRCVTRPLCALW